MRSRTPLFERLQRAIRIAAHCERTGEPVREALERQRLRPTRRRVLLETAVAAGAGLALVLPVHAAPPARGLRVAVVGAGLAGLYAASLLEGKGAQVQVYDAEARVGGRVWSLRDVFPGQVAERGAELIDTTHVTLRGLAGAYGLTLESYQPSKHPGDEAYYFDGRHWSEAEVVDEFRAFVPALKDDMTRLSGGPTALAFNAFDRELDLMPLSHYLDTRRAGPLLRAVLDVAYTIEFGREIDRQSALSMIFFIAANRRHAFTPFGVFSDERFHIVEGNDAVPRALAASLAQPVATGHRLVKVASLADGRVRLGMSTPGGARDVDHDAVILAIPAPAMRQLSFASSVSLGSGQRYAIANLDVGTNSKLMLGFRGRPWFERSGSNGGSYSDLAKHQATWESNPSLGRNGERGVITDYSGGDRGARLDPKRAPQEAQAFLGDFDRVYPGSAALARRGSDGRLVTHLENWSKLSSFMGAYTNNQPGYFTTIEGLYARPAGRVYFAGEHTDSFYSYQGFMEGALLSGARAADEVLRGR